MIKSKLKYKQMKNREPWNFCKTPEEKCTMNYCDDNGCQNRKRNYVEDNDPIADAMLSLPDIRNKLSPIKNLIAMLENGLMEGTIEVHPYIQKEMEQCKKSIAYLSGNEA